MDPDELRQMAAEELAKSDPEIQRAAFEQAFREADPKNAELLDRVTELVEEIQPQSHEEPDDFIRLREWPDPWGVAFRAGWQREHQEMYDLARELLDRLKEFDEQTDLTVPDELWPDRDNSTEGDKS